ncbi:MAG: sulfur transferase domain-containing protein [Planctomycetota bacterium]
MSFPGLSLTRLGLALALVLSVAACRTGGDRRVEPQSIPLRSSEMGSMHNVSVAGSIWFGGIPDAADLDLAQRRGIRTVIALCEPGWDPAPLETRVGALGMNFVRVPVREGDSIPDGSVDRVLEALATSDEEPALMFCDTGGQSAMFFAIHRVIRGELPLEEALVEARRAGMKPGPSEEFVRAQLERLQDTPEVVASEAEEPDEEAPEAPSVPEPEAGGMVPASSVSVSPESL